MTISYSRPNTKGRQIFSNIEPYGLVWRKGANSATKIKLTDSVEIEGALDGTWRTDLTLHVVTDVDARVMANIDKAMQGEKKPYYFASIYYYNHNKDMHIARVWMETWDKMRPNQYNIKYWLARIQLKAGDKQAAIATANESLKLAQQESSAEYVRMNREVLADAGN